MRSRSRHAVLAVAALILGAFALSAASADALSPNSSQITAPAGPTIFLADLGQEGPPITVAGTTNMAEVELRCYYSGNLYSIIQKEVSTPKGSFSVGVSRSVLAMNGNLCRLRAVPVSFAEEAPPSEEGPFNGPLIAPNEFKFEPTSGESTLNSLTAFAFIGRAENCGLETHLIDPVTLEETPYLFYCNGGVTDQFPEQTRPPARVDGTVVYGPNMASNAEGEAKPSSTLPGKPAITIVSKSFDESTGNTTYTEQDPFVSCAPEPNVYPTKGSCTSFASAGVMLERTWTTSASLHVIAQLDVWHSTDGKPHEVAVNYYNEFEYSGAGGAFLFPGMSAFTGTSGGQTIALPGGPGTVLYKYSSATPDGGNNKEPQGALVYDRAPTGPLTFIHGTAEKGVAVYEAPYTLHVPAGGTSTLRMTYVTGFGLPEIKTQAEAALAGFAPTISIGAPANGASFETESASVAVSGSASDSGALAGVSVNGVAATIGAGGAWTATVPLKAGANTITATATDQAGLTRTAAITVTYKIPPGKAALSGKVSASKGKVVFSLKCTGAPGAKCQVKDSLKTIERRKGAKIVGLLARIKKKTVTVASGAQTIDAGKTAKVTLKLNATGRALLKRFHKLPAHLSVTIAATPKAKTVISKSLTITPPKHKH